MKPLKPGCMWSLIAGFIVFIIAGIFGLISDSKEQDLKILQKKIELEKQSQVQALETPEMLQLRDFKKKYDAFLISNFKRLQDEFPEKSYIKDIPAPLQGIYIGYMGSNNNIKVLYFLTDRMIDTTNGAPDLALNETTDISKYRFEEKTSANIYVFNSEFKSQTAGRVFTEIEPLNQSHNNLKVRFNYSFMGSSEWIDFNRITP